MHCVAVGCGVAWVQRWPWESQPCHQCLCAVGWLCVSECARVTQPATPAGICACCTGPEAHRVQSGMRTTLRVIVASGSGRGVAGCLVRVVGVLLLLLWRRRARRQVCKCSQLCRPPVFACVAAAAFVHTVFPTRHTQYSQVHSSLMAPKASSDSEVWAGCQLLTRCCHNNRVCECSCVTRLCLRPWDNLAHSAAFHDAHQPPLSQTCYSYFRTAHTTWPHTSPHLDMYTHTTRVLHACPISSLIQHISWHSTTPQRSKKQAQTDATTDPEQPPLTADTFNYSPANKYTSNVRLKNLARKQHQQCTAGI